MTSITTDPEFRDWIIPLSQEEYSELEKSILEDGCRDPLVIWDDVIVDGHHRYDICTKHGIPYQTVEKKFDDRESVKIWMFHNQIARRNLNAFQRSELALRVEHLISARAKENLKTHTKDGYQPLLKSTKAVDTREEVAKLAQVSSNTIYKVKKIIENKPAPEVLDDLRKGEGNSINAVYSKIHRQEKKEKLISERAEIQLLLKPPDDGDNTVDNIYLEIVKKLNDRGVDHDLTHEKLSKDTVRVLRGAHPKVIDGIIPFIAELVKNPNIKKVSLDDLIEMKTHFDTTTGEPLSRWRTKDDPIPDEVDFDINLFWSPRVIGKAGTIKCPKCGHSLVLPKKKDMKAGRKKFENEMGSGWKIGTKT